MMLQSGHGTFRGNLLSRLKGGIILLWLILTTHWSASFQLPTAAKDYQFHRNNHLWHHQDRLVLRQLHHKVFLTSKPLRKSNLNQHSPPSFPLHSQIFQNDSKSPDSPKRKFPFVPNPVLIVKSIFKSSMAFQMNFRKKFAALPRKAKAVVSLQLMALCLMLGYGARNISQVIVQRQSIPSTFSNKPVEVPYSVFLNMVEKSGEGHVPGQNPALLVDNIIIGRDRIGFKVKPDFSKHELALKDKKLVEANDVSIQNVRERQLYTYKVNANPELIQFLRDNTMSFRAASDKTSNAAGTLVRSSILIVYMLFLIRMYRTMAGGGKSDTPGKLAKQLASDPKSMVKFEDIEGIDGAKFEVMELVDSLKNPGKYAILGARAPTGLLLEGPPGTGKTMLARACAATAGVPLLYCSGSDFVEVSE